MMITRRGALALTGAAAATLAAPAIVRAAAPFTKPPLPYGADALEPHISARTMAIHADIIHQSAYDRLNALVTGTDYADMSLEEVVQASAEAAEFDVYSNAAEAWNHDLYFAQFAGGWSTPGPILDEMLGREFGGLDGRADQLVETAGTVFGDGWVWLTVEGDALFLEGWHDAGNPIGSGRQIIFGADLWEHAYFLDRETRRADYLRAIVTELVNWDAMEQTLMDG